MKPRGQEWWVWFQSVLPPASCLLCLSFPSEILLLTPAPPQEGTMRTLRAKHSHAFTQFLWTRFLRCQLCPRQNMGASPPVSLRF